MDLINRSPNAFKEFSCKSTLKNAPVFVGRKCSQDDQDNALTYDVTFCCLQEEDAERLASLLDVFTNGPSPDAAADKIAVAVQTLTGGELLPRAEGIARAIALLAAFDSHSEFEEHQHPFVVVANGSMAAIIEWLRNGGPKACPSCGGPRHLLGEQPNGKGRYTSTQRYNAICACLRDNRSQFFCPICRQLVAWEERTAHVADCAALFFGCPLHVSQNDCALEGKTAVDVSAAPWEQFTFHVCPFRNCVDPDLAGVLRQWPDDATHLWGNRTMKAPYQPFPFDGQLASFPRMRSRTRRMAPCRQE